MGKLTYFKWMLDDVEVLKENFYIAQVGELFLAVMDYVKTGEVKEVSPELRFPYADYRKKVDRANSKYDGICKKRAEAGAKGGNKKAERNKQNKQSPFEAKKFSPPTRKQFHEAVEAIADKEDLDIPPNYEIDSLFDSLAEKGWKIDGAPIQRRGDWEKFVDIALFDERIVFTVFKYAFSAFNGFRDEAGESKADWVAWNFTDEGSKLPGGIRNWKEEFNKYAETFDRES